mgnify:FL=1
MDLLPKIRIMAQNHAGGQHPWTGMSDEELLKSAGLYGRDIVTGEEGYNLAAIILANICNQYGYIIKALKVMPDHIHIFADCPQTVAPCDIVRTLKSISAIEMFKAYPQLKQFYSRCGVLWSRGYFVSTVGHISEATVKKYIEEQKDHE